MAVWDKKILWAVMLVLTGALGQRVNYPDPVCGVKGSTVLLPCSFNTLKSVNRREVLIEIIRVVWCKNHEICFSLTPSVYDSKSNNNNSRYRYLGDKKRNCTLQISDLQKEDDATFRFRMEANDVRASFTGQSGMRVSVVDGDQMKIRSSRDDGEFKRGEAVTLNCFAAICTIHQLEVTWFRDGHALSETGPALHLSNLTAKDSGKYTCGLKRNERTLSIPYSLHVEGGGGGLLLIVGGRHPAGSLRCYSGRLHQQKNGGEGGGLHHLQRCRRHNQKTNHTVIADKLFIYVFMCYSPMDSTITRVGGD
ncbi:sialoadhesin-like [Sander lucioperca]|uniref:sialoadhesin-like n=1 Tax=Sander lucioperca TaxID=283035 RepID=UPI0016534C83|nr:sialoadhesin-like [Sander lucioperca]